MTIGLEWWHYAITKNNRRLLLIKRWFFDLKIEDSGKRMQCTEQLAFLDFNVIINNTSAKDNLFIWDRKQQKERV